MKQEPLFLKPVFHEKIWGGRNLKPILAMIFPRVRLVNVGQFQVTLMG